MSNKKTSLRGAAKRRRSNLAENIAPSWVEINLKHFRSNLKQIESKVKNNAKLLLVVKSNAYGHGIVEISKAASKCSSVVYLGVSIAEEALLLRENKIKKPILVLASVEPKTWDKLIRKKVSFTISSRKEAVALNQVAKKLKQKIKVHVDMDTGMTRFGIDYTQILSSLFFIHSLSHLVVEGAYTHFPSADQKKSKFTKRQIELFKMATDLFCELYPKDLRYRHLANSAGILNFPHSHFNLVRPGIAAYGVPPTDGSTGIHLKPILEWKSKLCLIKDVDKNTSISYGQDYQTKKRTKIGIIPVGYSSGYPFRLSGKAKVWIKGKSYPIVGRVTMDQIMVDLGLKTKVKTWDEVVLLSGGNNKDLSAQGLAKKAGTISYEILCGINTRIPRRYKH